MRMTLLLWKRFAAALLLAAAPGAFGLPPAGELTQAEQQLISGWAQDPDFDGPLEVDIHIDGVLVKHLLAGGKAANEEGYTFSWRPIPLGHGRHQVELYARDRDALGNPVGEARLLSESPKYIEDSCYGLEGSAAGWCAGLDEYWIHRQEDTEYVGNRLVRAGVNRSYGGTIFQLYGKDWDTNVILEHGGGAVQLSIWGYSEQGAHVSDGLLHQPCPGWKLTSPWNPIQAQAENCYWTGPSNDVAEARWEGERYYTKHDFPCHFTSNQPAPPMSMEQWVTAHPGYIEIRYRLSYAGEESWTLHPQEIPAIFAAYGMNKHYYYYDGDAPFTGAAPIHQQGNPDSFLRLPGFDEYGHGDTYLGYAREGWLTVCDEKEERCLTVAAFDPIVNELAISDNKANEGYITVLGHFRVEPGMRREWRIYLFPYRYDAAIGETTVRMRISELADADFKQRSGAR